MQKKKKKRKKDGSDEDRRRKKHAESAEQLPFVWDTEEGFGDDDDDDYKEEPTAGKKRKLNKEAPSAAKEKPEEPTAGLQQLVDNQAGFTSDGKRKEHGAELHEDDHVEERILMDVGFEHLNTEDIGDNIQEVQVEVHKENKSSEDSEIEFLEVTTASSETMEKFKQRENEEKERQKKEIYNEIKKCSQCEPTLCCMKHIFQITAISIKKDVDGEADKRVDVKKEKEEDDKQKKKDEQEAEDKSIDQRPKGMMNRLRRHRLHHHLPELLLICRRPKEMDKMMDKTEVKQNQKKSKVPKKVQMGRKINVTMQSPWRPIYSQIMSWKICSVSFYFFFLFPMPVI